MEQSKERHSLEEILREVEQQSLSPSDLTEPTADGQQESEGTGSLGTLFSDPALLAKLPALLRVVQTLTDGGPKQDERRPESPEQLLCALRPYLSEGRKQALDTMMRVLRLGESIKSLK